jgi:thymidine phosphorylase
MVGIGTMGPAGVTGRIPAVDTAGMDMAATTRGATPGEAAVFTAAMAATVDKLKFKFSFDPLLIPG